MQVKFRPVLLLQDIYIPVLIIIYAASKNQFPFQHKNNAKENARAVSKMSEASPHHGSHTSRKDDSNGCCPSIGNKTVRWSVCHDFLKKGGKLPFHAFIGALVFLFWTKKVCVKVSKTCHYRTTFKSKHRNSVS